MLKPNRKVAIISLAVILGAAAVTYVALWAFSIDLENEGAAHSSPEPSQSVFVGNGLITSNRDRFAVCLDSYGFTGNAPNVHDELVAALDQADNHPRWQEWLGSNPPTIDTGCPQLPALFHPDADITRTPFGFLVHGPTVTTTPSEYRVFFYIIPDFLMDERFVETLPIATQEGIQIGHQFDAVTYALFATPTEMASVEYASQLIKIGANLEPGYSLYDAIGATAPPESSPVVTPTPVATVASSQAAQ